MVNEGKKKRIIDGTLRSQWSLRPGSFTALMALYESNFLRLNWILDEMDFLKGDYVSVSDNDFPLYLSVKEVCRYTTSIHLTYWFDGSGDHKIADPDLDIRIYHDARQVEAVSCRHSRRHEVLQGFATEQGSELSRRWVRNIMLNKWLEYCMDCQHRFRPVNQSEQKTLEKLKGSYRLV